MPHRTTMTWMEKAGLQEVEEAGKDRKGDAKVWYAALVDALCMIYFLWVGSFESSIASQAL